MSLDWSRFGGFLHPRTKKGGFFRRSSSPEGGRSRRVTCFKLIVGEIPALTDLPLRPHTRRLASTGAHQKGERVLRPDAPTNLVSGLNWHSAQLWTILEDLQEFWSLRSLLSVVYSGTHGKNLCAWHFDSSLNSVFNHSNLLLPQRISAYQPMFPQPEGSTRLVAFEFRER